MIASYTGTDPDGNQVHGDHPLPDSRPFQGREDVIALAQTIATGTGLTDVRVLSVRQGS